MEKPITVLPPAEVIKPAEPASPPDAPEAVAPSIGKLNPPMAVSVLYNTEPELVINNVLFSNSHPSVILRPPSTHSVVSVPGLQDRHHLYLHIM